MAPPDTIQLEGGTSRTSGISSQSITAGSNYLGSAIDNSSNLDMFADIEIEWSCATAPTADKNLELYLLYAQDGTNYEDGDSSTDPKVAPAGVAPAYADTATHRKVIRRVKVEPQKLKILIKSELDQDATVSVNVQTYNGRIAD